MQINEQMILSLLSGLIGSMLTFISGVVYTTIQRKKDYKLKYRSSLKVEELYDCTYDLSNKEIKENSKIIANREYNEFREKCLYDEDFKNLKGAFLKIKNIGPGFVVNLRFNIESKYNNEKSSKIEFVLDRLDENEEIYVCLMDLKFLDKGIDAKRIYNKTEVEFMTSAREELKQSVELSEQERIKEKFEYKKFWKCYKHLYNFEIEPISWYFTKHKSNN